MKNERGVTLKRFACMVIMLCLVCSVAVADMVDDFIIFASVFGCPTFDSSDLEEYNGYRMIEKGDCRIAFKGERIIVDGKGEEFAPYCMAAIMVFEPETATFTQNAGEFYARYLMCRSNPEELGTTSSGYTFLMQKDDDANTIAFTIGK